MKCSRFLRLLSTQLQCDLDFGINQISIEIMWLKGIDIVRISKYTSFTELRGRTVNPETAETTGKQIYTKKGDNI